MNLPSSSPVTTANGSCIIQQNLNSAFSQPTLSSDWLDKICRQVINDMTNYGICVIDNFLGEATGDSIVEEVNSMYKYGAFQEGQLVRRDIRIRSPSQVIRGDKIIWVNGSEPNCNKIRYLMQTLDTILGTCNKIENNGAFSKYQIKSRTNAMIACYPGCGTHYVKHVDNPHEDGRRITSIYYLNKNWDVEKDGGLLRLYPTCNENHVADIAPNFDRVIFFWSDRRNPHEVLPSYSIRLAITVWYFDSEERNQSLQRNGFSLT